MVRDRANVKIYENFKLSLEMFPTCLGMLKASLSFISFHLTELEHQMYINILEFNINV